MFSPVFSVVARSRRAISYFLVAITLVLFMVTGKLYVDQDEQRKLISEMVRTSSWTIYQAQLELVKTMAALDSAVEKPTPDKFDALNLRLELLESRLPILYTSHEAWLLQNVEGHVPDIKAAIARVDAAIDELPSLSPDNPASIAKLIQWRQELEPLAPILQAILQSSTVFNEEVYRRERELAQIPPIAPLFLTFLSSSLLIMVLLLERTRDRHRLADITAARTAQAAVEANLRAVIQATPATIVIFDPETKEIAFVSPGLSEMFSASASDSSWPRLIDAAMEAWGMPNASWGSVTIAFPDNDGHVRSLRGAICEVIWEKRSQLLLALVDVTQIRHWELQLMQTAKLVTLGEMASAIAHELNQPLAVIRMVAANAKRMLTAGAPIEAVDAKLDRISDQVERTKRITDQVRRYGRLPSQQVEPFALRAALDLAVSFVAEQYRASGIRLKIDFDQLHDLMVRGEQTMFEQVIVNLLINARDAFDSAPIGVRGSNVTIRAHVTGDDVVIEVEDEAGGIQPDVLGKLFDAFVTTKPADKGTGLGLTMSRTIVRDMKGTITAENTERGARFIVVLPVLRRPQQMDAA